MSKLSLEARALVRHARAQEPLATAAQMNQVRRGVSAALVAASAQAAGAQAAAVQGAGVQAAGGATSQIVATVAPAAAPLLKLGSVLVVGVAVGVGGWQLQQRLFAPGPDGGVPAATVAASASASTPSVATPHVVASATAPGSREVAPEVAPEAPEARAEKETTRHVATGSAATRADAAPQSVRLERELRLLADVQEKLRQGQGQRALELLDRQNASETSQQLAEERLAAEVFAACAAGKIERARRAAKRFLALAPGSPLAFRVRQSCGATAE